MLWPDLPPRPEPFARSTDSPYRGIGYVWACRDQPLRWSTSAARSIQEVVRTHRDTCKDCPSKARKPSEQEVARREAAGETRPRVVQVPFVVPVTEEGPPPWSVAQVEDVSDPNPDALLLSLAQCERRALTWLRQVLAHRRSRERVLTVVRSTLRVEWGVEADVASLRRVARLARTEQVRPWPSPRRLIILTPRYQVTWEHVVRLAADLRRHVPCLPQVDASIGTSWGDRLALYAATEVALGIAPHTPAWWGLVASAAGLCPIGTIEPRRMVLLDGRLDR